MATTISGSSLITNSASRMKVSPTLEINELVLAARAKGKNVVHLGFGEATFPLQRDVLATHQEASRATSYMPVAGHVELRKASTFLWPVTSLRCLTFVPGHRHFQLETIRRHDS